MFALLGTRVVKPNLAAWPDALGIMAILQVCAGIAVGKTISSITQIDHSMTLAAGVAVRGKLGYSPWVKGIKKPPHG